MQLAKKIIINDKNNTKFDNVFKINLDIPNVPETTFQFLKVMRKPNHGAVVINWGDNTYTRFSKKTIDLSAQHVYTCRPEPYYLSVNNNMDCFNFTDNHEQMKPTSNPGKEPIYPCISSAACVEELVSIDKTIDSLAYYAFMATSITNVNALSANNICKTSQSSRGATFYQCKQLTDIWGLSSSYDPFQSAGSIFSSCTKLEDFNVLSAINQLNPIKTIGVYFFSGTALSNASFFDKLTSLTLIQANAFSGVRNLSSIDFSQCPLERIEKLAFYDCTKLSSVTFSKNTKLKRIGMNCFEKAKSMKILNCTANTAHELCCMQTPLIVPTAYKEKYVDGDWSQVTKDDVTGLKRESKTGKHTGNAGSYPSKTEFNYTDESTEKGKAGTDIPIRYVFDYGSTNLPYYGLSNTKSQCIISCLNKQNQLMSCYITDLSNYA